jgi:hypothetical protein
MMTPVISSNIESVGHSSQKGNEEWAEQTLRVSFKFGGTYMYHPVDEELFNEMLEAESVGKFFIAAIKNNPNISFEEE